MAFCGNCGAQIQDHVKFCPGCGQQVGAVPVQMTEAARAPAIGAQDSSIYTPPVLPGAPRQNDIRDAQDNKTMSVLAYILFFIPLLTGAHKTSDFTKFHTNQGTVLAITAIVWSIVYGVLSTILLFLPYVGWTLIVVLGLTGFIFLILCIVGIINVVNGQMKPLPVIGKFTIIK